MKFDRYLSIMFVVNLVTICCFSIGCDDMQMLDVMDKPGVMGPSEMYLSLASESEEALTPINDSSEWSGSGYTWEKIKGGDVPPQPVGPLAWEVDTFEHWIYTHAVSQMTFELPDHGSAKFEAGVLLPNYCDGTATVEIVALADSAKIYTSGVINTEEVVDIAFEIPAYVTTLTLQVNDGGDDITCDHYILGNSRLTFMPPQPVMPATEASLSLTSQSPDAITAINVSSEWSGFIPEIWEKFKGEETPEMPNDNFVVDPENTYEHWFYSFPISRMDFHLKGRSYSYFEGAVMIPRYCGGSIEVIWLADNVEVYNSGLIKPDASGRAISEIQFEFPANTKVLTLNVTDGGDGISCDHYIIGNPRLLQTKPGSEPPVTEPLYEGTYLSLTSKSENAITPINDSSEWTGWVDTWEKNIGEELPPKPDSYPESGWDINTFQHWFFSYARSKMVFELGDHNFVYFDSAVVLPRLCEDRASIRVYWLADDVEVFDSGVIKDSEIRRVGFDIPPGTRILTLIVGGTEDGIACDDFFIGNPRLLTERPVDAPPPQIKDIDPDKSLPEIALTAELEPGRYRIRTSSITYSNYKITRLTKTIGDPEDRIYVRILLDQHPWSETAGGEEVIGYTTLYGEIVPDEVVVEITRKIQDYQAQVGRNTNTFYEYEGTLIRNISKPEIIIEYEVIEPEPFMSIVTESGEAIIANNNAAQWSGWDDKFWGKVKGEVASTRPTGFVTNPSVETFEHWFYSHALSRMEFELGMHNYTYFDSFVVLPNPCGTIASVEVIWFADDMEVYNSGIVRGGDIWRVGFDIPAGTQTLTLQVTDAGNGNGCDHFVIGNPTLHLTKPVSEDMILDPAIDPDMSLPEILLSADVEPGNYRLTSTSVVSRSDKIVSVGRYIGDPLDRVSVRILLEPQPWNETLDGHPVIGSQIVEGRSVRDQVVIEITEMVRVVTETRGGRTYTVHEYNGIAIKNLTNPQNVFEYGDR